MNEENKVIKNKSKGIIVGIAIAIVAIVAICFVMYATANSPTRRAMKAVELGKHYYDEMDYEKALAEFAEALEIDPNNKDIQVVADTYIGELIDMGYDYLNAEDYDEATNVANAILKYFPENELAEKLMSDIQEAIDEKNLEDADNEMSNIDEIEEVEESDEVVEVEDEIVLPEMTADGKYVDPDGDAWTKEQIINMWYSECVCRNCGSDLRTNIVPADWSYINSFGPPPNVILELGPNTIFNADGTCAMDDPHYHTCASCGVMYNFYEPDTPTFCTNGCCIPDGWLWADSSSPYHYMYEWIVSLNII